MLKNIFQWGHSKFSKYLKTTPFLASYLSHSHLSFLSAVQVLFYVWVTRGGQGEGSSFLRQEERGRCLRTTSATEKRSSPTSVLRSQHHEVHTREERRRVTSRPHSPCVVHCTSRSGPTPSSAAVLRLYHCPSPAHRQPHLNFRSQTG